jgi:hypothetical protein
MKTIKCIFTILLFSAFSFYEANAQSFKGGLLAGLSTSQVDGDTHSGYYRAGIIAGGYVGLNISEKLSGQMEMKFIQKGSYKSQNPNAGDYTIYCLRLNYVEMPFLIKYKYKYKLTFETGLGFGYLASYKEGNENGPFPDYVQIPFHKFELSYHIGSYYQLFKRLSVNVRYSYSLLPIRQHINGENKFLFNKGQFNNVICFSFYYQFNKPSE